MFTFPYNKNQRQNEDDSNPYLFIHKFIQFLFPFILFICFPIGLPSCSSLASTHNYTLCGPEANSAHRTEQRFTKRKTPIIMAHPSKRRNTKVKKMYKDKQCFSDSSCTLGKLLTVIAFPRVYSFDMTRVDPYQNASAYDA